MVLGLVSAVQSRRGDRLSSAKRNMHSVLDNTHVVSDYLEAEMNWGAVLCPFAPDNVPGAT